MSIPGSASPLFLASTAAAGAYEIPRSLRFNSADSSYLNRTPSSAGNKLVWTWSAWVKRNKIGANQSLFGSAISSSDDSMIFFTNDDYLRVWNYRSSGYKSHRITNAKFRDPSAWYHIVVSCNGSTSLEMYVNGVQQTFQTGGVLNVGPDGTNWHFNTTREHNIGRHISYYYSDVQLADINWIDGQALAPTDFGEYDDNNVWQPIKYAGTYGTNGFHLDFSDTSSNSALGTDSSGAGNNWSVNNLSAAGSAWYNSQTWSNVLYTASGPSDAPTVTTKSFLSGYPATLPFNGNTNRGSNETYAADSLKTIVFRPGTALTGVTKLEIFTNGTYTTDAGYNSATSVITSNTNVGWQTLYDGTAITLNYVWAYKNNGQGAFSGLKINGLMLVDAGVSDPLAADIDALRDSPVNGDSANDTGAGGEITGNYATLNPLAKGSGTTLSNGNLEAVAVSAWTWAKATIEVTSGKWYWEITKVNAGANNLFTGIAKTTFSNFAYDLNHSNSASYDLYGYTSYSGNKEGQGSSTSYGAIFQTAGDIIGVALDMDAGTITFYKNGASQGQAYSGITGQVSPVWGGTTSVSQAHMNFGQRAFAYTAPSGYKALCVSNLPDPTIADGSTAFDTKLFTGNASTQSITGLNFSPSFVWTKSRSTTYSHRLYDAVRGANNWLSSNGTDVNTAEANTLTSFDANGFSVGATENSNQTSGGSAVAWTWSAGENSNHTYAVTVSNPGSGNKFYADGALQPTLTLAEGSTYKFDQSSGTNSTHPLRFSTTSDGTHGGGSEYTTGVTTSGTPGSAGAYTQIVIAASAPTLYAYCTAHSGMGFQINTSDTAGYTIPVGGENSALYDQSVVWTGNNNATTGPVTTQTGAYYSANNDGENLFDASLVTAVFAAATGQWIKWQPDSNYTFTNTVEIYTTNTTAPTATVTYSDDSTVTTAIPATVGWHAVATGGGVLKSLKMQASTGNWNWWAAVRIDGKMLIDSGVSVTSVPSISSRIQADPSKGFSIVTYTGNGSASQTVGHSLNSSPELMLVKSTDFATDWCVYHKGLATNGYLRLNSYAPAATDVQRFTSTPSASVLTVGTDAEVNYNTKNYIAYCFSPVKSYSAMGKYVGNGDGEGPFVYLGFKPAVLIIKGLDLNSAWHMWDSARNPHNLTNWTLYPSTAAGDGQVYVDFLSNGFKIKTNNGEVNTSNNNYIYYAAAENPFKTARAR